MDGYTARRDRLRDLVAQVCGDQVDEITDDPTRIRAGRVTVLIQPPDLSWDDWGEPETAWSIAVVAGVPWKQPDALDRVWRIIDLLNTSRRLNLKKGEPWTITADTGPLAGYLLTLNPMDNL